MIDLRNVYRLVSIIAILLLMSCASSYQSTDSNVSSNDTTNQLNYNLSDYLRKNTNLMIQGTHPNVAITIRGLSTIRGDNRPMFNVDGVNVGRDYARVDQLLNPNEIKSVRILSGLSQLAVYGEDGTNGIIMIKTNKK